MKNRLIYNIHALGKESEKMKKNKERGITLITLVLAVIILAILAGITVYSGRESINKANLEGIKTNMLLIEAKAKENVENARFKLGVYPTEATAEMQANAKAELSGDDKGIAVVSSDTMVDRLLEIGIEQQKIDDGMVYKLTTKNLENMGINNVESNDEEGWYIIVYDINNAEVEIYNTEGFANYYSLSEIEKIEL